MTEFGLGFQVLQTNICGRQKKKSSSVYISELPDYSKITFKTLKDHSVPLEEIIPDASPEATDLFKKFIIYDSNKRISATKALTHPYFGCNPLPAR